jgi:2-iminobutanoate/2-iminopropanoate deaminase
MQTIRRNPTDGIYAASPDYVHALEIRGHGRTLYVSGTMGLDQDGKAGADLDEQLTLIWNNIRRILAEADMTNRQYRPPHQLSARSILCRGQSTGAHRRARIAPRADDRAHRPDFARGLAGRDRGDRGGLRSWGGSSEGSS